MSGKVQKLQLIVSGEMLAKAVELIESAVLKGFLSQRVRAAGHRDAACVSHTCT